MEPESMAVADAPVEQASSTPETQSDQATPTETESFTSIDPSTLPAELQELWDKTYKSMQGDYTRKTTALSDTQKKAQEYDALMAEVEKMSKAEPPAQESPQETGEQLLTRILENPDSLREIIREEAKRIADPLFNESNAAKASAEYDRLLSAYPDLPEYEDQVAKEVAKGIPAETAIKSIRYDKAYQKGVDEGAKKVAARDATAQPSAAPASVIPNSNVSNIWEALKQAKKQLGQ